MDTTCMITHNSSLTAGSSTVKRRDYLMDACVPLRETCRHAGVSCEALDAATPPQGVICPPEDSNLVRGVVEPLQGHCRQVGSPYKVQHLVHGVPQALGVRSKPVNLSLEAASPVSEDVEPPLETGKHVAVCSDRVGDETTQWKHESNPDKICPQGSVPITSANLLPKASAGSGGATVVVSPSNSRKIPTGLLRGYLHAQQQSHLQTLRVREKLYAFERGSAQSLLLGVMDQYGVKHPVSSNQWVMSKGLQKFELDRAKQFAYSELLRWSKLDLPNFIRLVPGETAQDPWPNKALYVPDHLPCWRTYKYKDEWRTVVCHGVKPTWINDSPPTHTQQHSPLNHGSALRAMNAVIRSLPKGQDEDRYLILDISLLPTLRGITCSPFEAVQKGDADIGVEARVIHDLSCPKGISVNGQSQDGTLIVVTYDGAAILARRVMQVDMDFPGKARMSSGDVAGAFRNIPLATEIAGRFAGTVPELGVLVIDLSCPFGWTDSPRHCWSGGGAIVHLHWNSFPKWPNQPRVGADIFDGKAWCDDHVCIEPDIGSQSDEASLSLRSAMVTILGPDACNDEKFTPRCAEGKALGLRWDLVKMTLSMPVEKITKALDRVNAVQSAQSVSRKQLNQLLGSPRHVTTCTRAAAPFFQRILSLARKTTRFRASAIPLDIREDLRWFAAILRIGRLNSVPLSRFIDSRDPDHHINMDASDRGLCALWPARRQYLQVEFDDEELRQISIFNDSVSGEFSINIRELMSAMFVSIVRSQQWSWSQQDNPSNIRFWIDNSSAVAWTNRRSSRNSYAQMLLHLIALFEVRHNFYSFAEHVPGIDNVIADAGIRVRQSEELARSFANMTFDWTQVSVPVNSRKLSKLWELCSELEL